MKPSLVFALAISFLGVLTAGIYIGVRMAPSAEAPRIAANATSPAPIVTVDNYVDKCIESRSLLGVAETGVYGRSNREEQLDLVRVWCQGNTPRSFASLNREDQSFAVRRIRTQLDNLLTERDFDGSN